MRRRLILLLLVACGPEQATDAWQGASWPEPLDEGRVVEWTVHDAWGEESITVNRDGTSVLDVRIRSGTHGVHVERDLTDLEMEALRDELRTAGCCGLPSESVGPPEASLRIRLPELSCDVSLPLEGWEEGDALRCERRLRALHGRPRFRE